MRVLVKAKANFNSIEYTNVDSITFASGIYTIHTTGGTTATYSKDDYIVSILIS